MSTFKEEKEWLALKNFEDQLVTVLKKEDSISLCEKLFEKCVISKEVQDKFSSLDHVSLKEELKVRYLLQHINDAVKDNKLVYHSFIAILTEINEGVVSELNKELHLCELLEVLEDSQVCGTSEALVGSKRPRASIGEVDLCESDVPLLTELLADGADRAEELGVALHLTKSQIKECQKDCSIKMSLSNVILEWIRSSKVGCTLNNLKTALESSFVNLYNLALVLENKFVEGVKRNVSKKPCLCIGFLPKYRSGDITIARGKSALLGFQVTSLHPVQYEWRKNGHLLSDSSIYSGTTKSFLFINSADNNVQGQYECRVTDGQQQHTEQMHLSLCQTDTKFKKYFSNVYKVKKEVPENSWLPSSDKVINLAIISKGKTGKKEFAYAVQGDMDDILEGKEKVEYEEIFGQYESGSLLLVEGRPGCGKTTLMHKVSKDWELDKVLQGAEIVVLVPIRLLISANRSIDLADLFKNYIYNDKERVRVIDHYEKLGGEGVCFIIDGLDEYEHVKDYNTIILKLITKRVWPLAMIIVASRPVGTASLRNKGPEKTKRIEVLGLETHQISEYVLSYFRGNNEKAGTMMSYLETHINVYRMCYLPVHAAMICFLYDKKGDKIPQTESKIYEAFTLFSIVRKREQGQHTSMSSMTGSEREYFSNVCKLAFDMIVQSKQVMLQSQTNFPLTPIGSDKSSLGLVTIDSTAELFSLEDLYSFLHLTFQEYLAAFCLSQLDSESEVFRKTKGLKVNLRMVWKFYSGIVQFDKDSLILKSIMSDSRTDMLYKVQCAFESQQQIACDMLLELNEEPNSLFFYSKNLIPTDFLAMNYIIETSHDQVTKISFQKCSLDSKGVDLFLDKVSTGKLNNIKYLTWDKSNCPVSEFKLFFKILCKIQHSIETLELQSVDIFRPSIVKLFNGIEFSNLCTLKITYSLTWNVIPAAGAAVLTECLKSCTYLQTLDLRSKNIGSVGASALAKGLKSCTNLQRLHLYNNNIGSDGASVLAEGLKSCTNLQTLDLRSNKIGSRGATALAKILKSCTNLQTLDLSSNNIGSDCATALAEGLKSCTNLQTLDLRSNKIGSHGATALAKILKSCTNLQTLDLSSNNIGSDCATALAEGLKSCTNLQTLDLRSNDIGSDGATVLAEGLKSCTNLQTLDLRSNEIGSYGATALAENLKSCNNLQTLDLSSNNIGSDGATALAEGLKSCTNLQTLDLRSNDIGSDGATVLAEGLMSCTNLQTLDLRSNEIGSYGATALAENQKSCNNLQTLDLSSNNIGSDGAAALAERLKSCTNLQALYLRSNDIGSDGAAALAGLKSCTNLQTLS